MQSGSLPYSSVQCGAGGAIGAVHFGMAIEAATPEHESVDGRIIDLVTGIGHAGMARRGVALLTQQRRPAREKGWMVASVGLVAECAIFRHRSVLPQKRPALLGVTGKAGFIDRGLAQEILVIAIVWIVAAGAGHVSETERVTAGFQAIAAAFLVAAETHFLLRHGVEDPVVFDVNPMAGGAGQIGALVGAAEPAQPAMVLVAVEAHPVLTAHGCF